MMVWLLTFFVHTTIITVPNMASEADCEQLAVVFNFRYGQSGYGPYHYCDAYPAARVSK